MIRETKQILQENFQKKEKNLLYTEYMPKETDDSRVQSPHGIFMNESPWGKRGERNYWEKKVLGDRGGKKRGRGNNKLKKTTGNMLFQSTKFKGEDFLFRLQNS